MITVQCGYGGHDDCDGLAWFPYLQAFSGCRCGCHKRSNRENTVERNK